MIDAEQASSGYAALGNPARLRIFRILVTAGHDGLSIGFIQQELAIPLSTLAHHLAMLVKAGLVRQEKQGRQVICRANFEQMEHLIAYLTQNCCAGVAPEGTCGRDPEAAENAKVQA